jgi:hypothetical protein
MRHLIVIGFLLAAPRLALAQFPADVQPGTRVRVWIPEQARQNEGPYRRQLLRGNVESVDGSTLRLRIPGSSNALAIPRSSVRRLDISRGVNRGESMIERAAGGAIGGAITYALMNDPRRRGGPHYKRDWRAAGVGASWGAGIGAVIGLIFPHESWRRVIH